MILPKGVESVALIHGEDHDLPVVSIHKPKGVSTAEAAEDAGEDNAEYSTLTIKPVIANVHYR